MTTPQDPYGRPPEGEAVPPQDPYGSPPSAQPGWGQAPQGQQPSGQQQPYGQQPWGTGGPGGGKSNGMGVAALVLGLLALVTSITIVGGIVFGVLAIVLGLVGRGRARRGEADNGGMAVAGVVLGLVGLLLSVLFLVIGVAIFSSDDGRNLIDCLTDAGDDQNAIEDCEREFEDSLGS